MLHGDEPCSCRPGIPRFQSWEVSSKKVNLNPGDLVSLNGENLIVHSTHTKKNGAVNVEFETPAKSGQKSASLKKLKIVKAANSIHPAWKKIS